MPWFLQINAKRIDSIDSLIDKTPVIDKTTTVTDTFKWGDCHDEIIHELWRNLDETTIEIVIPFLVYDEIFFRGLYIVRIEDDLAEMEVGY